MNKLAYVRDESEFAIESKVDEDTLNAALDMVAEGYGIKRASVTYLLVYGLKQSLQDSFAQPAASAKAEGGDVNAAIEGAINKRLDAIREGTVTARTGSGVSRDPEAQMRRTVIDEILKRSAAKSGKKLPKKDELTALRTATYEAHKDAIDKEVAKRMKATNSLDIEIEL